MPRKGIHVFCRPGVLSKRRILQRYSTLRKLAGEKIAPRVFVFISSHELVCMHSQSARYGFSLIKLKDSASWPIPSKGPVPIEKAFNKDRRLNPRVMLRRPIAYEIMVFPDPSRRLTHKRLRGSLINMGKGGIGIKTKHRLQADMIVSLRIPVGKMFVAVPTLAKVSWVATGQKQKEYRAGLMFII
jgi:hypothetical protein